METPPPPLLSVMYSCSSGGCRLEMYSVKSSSKGLKRNGTSTVFWAKSKNQAAILDLRLVFCFAFLDAGKANKQTVLSFVLGGGGLSRGFFFHLKTYLRFSQGRSGLASEYNERFVDMIIHLPTTCSNIIL